MKLHELQPADGSRKPRTRVGRGIAAGKGKTAGRGTKGQKARAGGSIQPWFEGGQTPLQIRIPKLRGFRNRLKLEYEVVNVGELSALAEFGALEAGTMPGSQAAEATSTAPVTVTQDILRAVGLVRTLDKPLKILGGGDVTRPLFVIADAFSKTAAAKIEAAGGTAQVLEVPSTPLEALGVVTTVGPVPTDMSQSAGANAPAETGSGPGDAAPGDAASSDQTEPSGPESL